MFGAPGSGKGTQSDLIVDRFRLTHISTGDLLRAEIKAGSEIGKKVEGLIAEGKLVSDDIIVALLRKKVETTKDTAGFIFDGFPASHAPFDALAYPEYLFRRQLGLVHDRAVDDKVPEMSDECDGSNH